MKKKVTNNKIKGVSMLNQKIVSDRFRGVFSSVLLFILCFSLVPVKGDSGKKTGTDEANKDLRIRLVNINSDAKNSERKSGKSLRIAPVFNDRMVLQRNRPIRIDGTAMPSSQVELELAGQRLNTRADRNGKWSLVLKPMAASSIPRKMTVRSGKSSQLTRSPSFWASMPYSPKWKRSWSIT